MPSAPSAPSSPAKLWVSFGFPMKLKEMAAEQKERERERERERKGDYYNNWVIGITASKHQALLLSCLAFLSLHPTQSPLMALECSQTKGPKEMTTKTVKSAIKSVDYSAKFEQERD